MPPPILKSESVQRPNITVSLTIALLLALLKSERHEVTIIQC